MRAPPAFKSFVTTLLFHAGSCQETYEPACDTTRQERDELRAAVQASLETSFDDPFESTVVGKMGNLGDVDPQGESLGYSFPVPIARNRRATFQYYMPLATDAILYLFCNPSSPSLALWSSTTYLVRYDATAGRMEPNAELGDSLNQFVLNSTALGIELPWGRTSAIITTADAKSAKKVTQALVQNGFDRSAINIQVVPSQISPRLGFGTPGEVASPSVFSTGFRWRGWDNEEEATAYSAYDEPVLYFTGNQADPEPFKTPVRRPRGGVATEATLQPRFNRLLNKVEERVESQGYKVITEAQMQRSNITDPQNCFFDFDNQERFTCFQGSQDISYGTLDAPRFPFPNASQGFDVVVGTIHTLTGLAQYASFGTLSNNVNTKNLLGTAKSWSGRRSDRKFFVLVVSANCSALNLGDSETICLEIAFRFGILGYVERAALEPATKTGPAFEDLLPAVVISFATEPTATN